MSLFETRDRYTKIVSNVAKAYFMLYQNKKIVTALSQKFYTCWKCVTRLFMELIVSSIVLTVYENFLYKNVCE